MSAGSVGCPQSEVVASREELTYGQTTSWQADCRGHSFICSVSGFSETRVITCSPMLAPVASAAPVLSSDDVARACAEASQYDHKAATGSGPAREQYAKMAEHRHRDCAAGTTAPGARASAPELPSVPPASP